MIVMMETLQRSSLLSSSTHPLQDVANNNKKKTKIVVCNKPMNMAKKTLPHSEET